MFLCKWLEMVQRETKFCDESATCLWIVHSKTARVWRQIKLCSILVIFLRLSGMFTGKALKNALWPGCYLTPQFRFSFFRESLSEARTSEGLAPSFHITNLFMQDRIFVPQIWTLRWHGVVQITGGFESGTPDIEPHALSLGHCTLNCNQNRVEKYLRS